MDLGQCMVEVGVLRVIQHSEFLCPLIADEESKRPEVAHFNAEFFILNFT